MGQTGAEGYGFEGLPLAPVEAGTNLLVAGPALSGTRDFALGLLRSDDAESGVLIVTSDRSAVDTLEDFKRVGGVADRRRVRVVDCTQEADPDLGECVSSVTTPADLTGIGIEYSNQYEEVYADGYEHVRTGLLTLTPLLVYSDDVRSVYRFINTVTGRIGTADGLGVSVIDPAAHDERVVGSVTGFFDGRIDVRESETGLELRVQGLPDQPTEWTAIDG